MTWYIWLSFCPGGGYMRRREFIVLLGAAAVASPLTVRGQQAMPVIGYLNSASPEGYPRELSHFHIGLKEAGFVEGQNVLVQYRWARDQYEDLPAMAADLVRQKVDLIVANGPAAPIAVAATTTIPIVFTAGFDPIRLGLVKSLNRPGSNVTGISILNVEVAPKRMEILRELVPTASVFGLLVNPSNPNADSLSKGLENAAKLLALKLHVLGASKETDFASAFARLRQLKIEGLVIGNDPFFTTRSRRLAELTNQHRIPAIYQYREFGLAGGLLSYGGSLTTTYRLAGVYAGRILRGESPAELPIQQSTNLELIINLKTAKALGIAVPITLLGRADEVIE